MTKTKYPKRVLLLAHPTLLPPIEVSKEVDLDKVPWRTEYYVIESLKKLGHNIQVLGVDSDLKVIKDAVESFKPHLAFNLLEQFDGEAVMDHNVVSYLEMIRVPYTGCNPKGLMIARDKSLSKKILSYHRVKVPYFSVAKKGRKFVTNKKMKFPLFVKSLTEEGSTGISQNSIVNDVAKLRERVAFIHETVGTDAIIESYIPGNDLYVSVMGDKNLRVLPPLILEFAEAPKDLHQIATSRVKWNPEYRKKYKIDVKKLEASGNQLEKITKLCKKIYKALNLSGYARMDLRLTPDGEIYFIEANPNPDIADSDEFAVSAAIDGLAYGELIEKIVRQGARS